MKTWWWLAVIVFMAGGGMARAAEPVVEVSALDSRPLDDTKATLTMIFLGKGVMGALSSQVFDHQDKLALCALFTLYAAEDTTPEIRQALIQSESRLIIGLDGERTKVNVRPAFIDVSFRPLAKGQDTKIAPTGDGRLAKCVVTEQSWSPQYSHSSAKLELMQRDSRVRTRKVIP